MALGFPPVIFGTMLLASPAEDAAPTRSFLVTKRFDSLFPVPITGGGQVHGYVGWRF